MNRMRALLVDLDGTLADTATANFNAYHAAFRERGVVVSRSAFEAVASGRHWSDFIPLLAPGLDEVTWADIARRKAEFYKGHIQTIPLNTAIILLLQSRRDDCLAALVTTARTSSVDAVLDGHGIRGLFDVIVTGDDVTRHKPSPDCYVLAAERLAVRPHECVAIEDSDVGVASACAFGAAILKVSILEPNAQLSISDGVGA